MWKYGILVLCLSGYCLAGPVGVSKRNIPIGEYRAEEDAGLPAQSGVEGAPSSAEMMIMSTLTLPSNATSIRADITDSFSCENKTYGYYADVENECQIFHVCLPVTYADGKENTFRWSFICPEETVFSQESFTCMRPEDMTISCEESLKYYELNDNFGNVQQETDKEMNAVATSETNMEVEPEAAKPETEVEEPMPVAQQPIKVQKPNRKKPGQSYAAQKRPVISNNLRKMPQAQQPQVNSIVDTQTWEVKDSDKPVEEEEIKPVVQKFSRRPVPAMSNSFKDKIQNAKPETMTAIRTDLYNQKRKRPTMFNKKPAEEAVEKTEEVEPAKEEEQVAAPAEIPEPNFPQVASEMSNDNTETQVADAEIQASETSEVFVKPHEVESTQVEDEAANAVELVNAEESVKAEEPVEAEETVIAEVPVEAEETVETAEAVNAEEPVEAVEPVKVEEQVEAEEPVISVEPVHIEEPAQAEETVEAEEPSKVEEETVKAVEPQVLEAFEEIPAVIAEVVEAAAHPEEEESVKMEIPAEEPQASEEIQTAEEQQAAQETETAEETQQVQENEAVEEEIQTAEEPQTAEVTKTVEVTQSAEEPQVVEEIQTADENQVAQETEAAEETQAAEENQMAQETETAEETEAAKTTQAVEEPAVVEQEILTVDETQAAEETQSAETAEETQLAEEAPIAPVVIEPVMESEVAEETKASDEVHESEPQETVQNEEVSSLESAQAAEEVQTDIASEDSAPAAEVAVEEETQQLASAEEPELIKSAVVPETTFSEPAIFEANSEEASVVMPAQIAEDADTVVPAQFTDNAPAAASPAQTIEEMEDERPAEAPESMPATEEMAEQDPIVQQMFEETNEDDKKQTIGGFKPVDPVMAAEAEQLIVDFINTLRRNEFVNEKPGMPMPMPVQESAEGSADVVEEETPKLEEDAVPEVQEQAADIKEHQSEEIESEPQIVETQVSSEENKAEKQEDAKVIVEEPQPEAETVAEESSDDSNNDFTLKSIEVPSSEEESQKQEEEPLPVANVVMSEMPQEIYQIPVQVVTTPLEEMPHQQSEEQSEVVNTPIEIPTNVEDKPESETPAMLMGGYKPLSIDDIVELVKERLDHMPKDEKEAPMQLDQVLNEVKPEAEENENTPQADDQQVEEPQESEEEIIMPIYQRAAEPLKVDAQVQTETKAESAVASDNAAAPALQEKANRSYRSRSMLNAKLDPRKRRFLFRSDDS